MLDLYYEKLFCYEEELMEDLAELVSVRSVREETSASDGKPFGKGVRDVFNKMLSIAQRDGFKHEDFDGYALHIEHGNGEEIVGILAHLDIVPEGNLSNWLFDPFLLTNHDGHLYGRGVNDDKAPAIAAYYALKILRDLGFTFERKVRLILGGAEETTWECMDHYFKENKQPEMAFSPDGDFPIVNGEKGVIQGYFELESQQSKDSNIEHTLIKIESERQRGFICQELKAVYQTEQPEKLRVALQKAVKVEITDNTVTAVYQGDTTLSRNPHKGSNAIFRFAEDLSSITVETKNSARLKHILHNYLQGDVHGIRTGLFAEDEEMGVTTFGLPYLLFDGTTFEIGFDYRFPKTLSQMEALNRLRELEDHWQVKWNIVKEHETLYIPPESDLIKRLKHAYKNVTGREPECITKGGISYARALNNCVAFGPTFENDTPNTHKPNEKIRIASLHKAIIIYCETIRLLATS